ncbi:MAG: nucleotidyltransferase family protein [Pseudomonadota bacterium]
MTPTPTPTPLSRAMVMAAGLGTRMQPLTRDRPKPLIAVNSKPLIDYTLDELMAGGVTTIIANVHYLADQIEAHMRDNRREEILVSDERDALLETGGGLVKARALIGPQPFFCCNTDAIFAGTHTGTAIRTLRTAWQDQMKALLLLVPINRARGFDGNGDFHLDPDGHITKAGEEAATFAFTGLQILDPVLLDDLPTGAFSTRVIWRKAAAMKQIFGVIYPGTWLHVGTPAAITDAEAMLNRLDTRAATPGTP